MRDIITVTEEYPSSKQPGLLHTDYCSEPCRTERVLQMAMNGNVVDMEGVNHVVVIRESYDTDSRRFIAQASGYTEDRGAFCDCYSTPDGFMEEN